jgi:4-hydroxybenzoate polyprenyltransferase
MAWLTVLGIPAGVYVASIVALISNVAGAKQNPFVLLAVLMLTMGIYMFHRTAIVCVEQMQARHRISVSHRRLLLSMAVFFVVASAFLFVLERPAWAGLVFLSVVGIVVYGRTTCISPVRTRTYIKPFAVGSAIAVFGWVLNDFSMTPLALLAFVLLCSADALLCDLVDRAYDAASGCTTLASKFGAQKTWCIAGALYIVAIVCFNSPVGWFFMLLFPLPIVWRRGTRTIIDVRPLFVLLLAYSL